MALDLSMNSSRPRPLPCSPPSPCLDPPCGPPSPLLDIDTPLALVTKKRVRFQEAARAHLHPHPHHPYSRGTGGGRGTTGTGTMEGTTTGGTGTGTVYAGCAGTWTGVVLHVTDSDEENRPPSSASSHSTSSGTSFTSSGTSSGTSCTPSGTSYTSSGTSCTSWGTSSGTSSMETPPSCDRLSGSPTHHQERHPAAVTGHVTVPAPRDVTLSSLPSDPREWSRADVGAWLAYMKRSHDLVQLQPERFLMNGKALCLMNPAMFCYRVPAGGRLLYRDFRTRLSHALQQAAASTTALQAATPTYTYTTPTSPSSPSLTMSVQAVTTTVPARA